MAYWSTKSLSYTFHTFIADLWNTRFVTQKWFYWLLEVMDFFYFFILFGSYRTESQYRHTITDFLLSICVIFYLINILHYGHICMYCFVALNCRDWYCWVLHVMPRRYISCIIKHHMIAVLPSPIHKNNDKNNQNSYLAFAFSLIVSHTHVRDENDL